jgi:hypothetical protein
MTHHAHHYVRFFLDITVASGKADVVEGGAAAGSSGSGGPVDYYTESEARSANSMELRLHKLGGITCLAVCSKIFKNVCAVGDSFGNVMLLGLGTEVKREIHQLCLWRDHTDKVNCLAFNANGHNLVTGSSDMTIRVYSLLVEKPNGTTVGVRRVEVTPCFVAPGGIRPFEKNPNATTNNLLKEVANRSGLNVNQTECNDIDVDAEKAEKVAVATEAARAAMDAAAEAAKVAAKPSLEGVATANKAAERAAHAASDATVRAPRAAAAARVAADATWRAANAARDANLADAEAAAKQAKQAAKMAKHAATVEKYVTLRRRPPSSFACLRCCRLSPVAFPAY